MSLPKELEKLRDEAAEKFMWSVLQRPFPGAGMSDEPAVKKLSFQAGFDTLYAHLLEGAEEFPEMEFHATLDEWSDVTANNVQAAKWAWSRAQAQVKAWKAKAEELEEHVQIVEKRMTKKCERIAELERENERLKLGDHYTQKDIDKSKEYCAEMKVTLDAKVLDLESQLAEKNVAMETVREATDELKFTVTKEGAVYVDPDSINDGLLYNAKNAVEALGKGEASGT